jgi:fermentation-respiration switch protein FrsA (DUF1100 family)
MFRAPVSVPRDHVDWNRTVESILQKPLSVPPEHIFWILGVNSIEDVLKRLEKFKLSGIAEMVECPYLLLHGEEDELISVGDAIACYNAVGSKDKTLKVFTAKEGGSHHCHVDYFGVAIPYMHDWLAEKLR